MGGVCKMVSDVASVVAVAGAWVAGLAVLFSIYCFCFSTIKIQLLRYGLIWLLVTDGGLILMLAALLFVLNDTTTIVFTVIGLVALVALTVAIIAVVRVALARNRTVQVFDQTRQRLEF